MTIVKKCSMTKPKNFESYSIFTYSSKSEYFGTREKMVIMFDRFVLKLWSVKWEYGNASIHDYIIMQGWLMIFQSPICRFESKAVKTASFSGALIHTNWYCFLVTLDLPNNFNFDTLEQSHHLLRIAIQFVATYRRKSW